VIDLLIAYIPTIFWVSIIVAYIACSTSYRSLFLRLALVIFALWFINHITAEYTASADEELVMNVAEANAMRSPYKVSTSIEKDLSITQVNALKEASQNGFAVRGHRLEIGKNQKRIIVLGERKFKNSEAGSVGERVVGNFKNIGVEYYEPGSKLSELTLHAVRSLYTSPLKALSKFTPFVSGPTANQVIEKADLKLNFETKSVLLAECKDPAITLCSNGRVAMNLESGNLEAFNEEYEKLTYIGKTVLIDQRNLRMMENIKQFFQTYPEKEELLIVVDAAHVSGMERLLSSH
jgi:hypothetical protein